MDQHPRHRILICAPTDSGVDELVRRLLQLRLRQEEGRFKSITNSLVFISFLIHSMN